ncbi:MAG: glycosyltransferase family 4 protein [Sulfurovum sp.]|nr:glycosyltransferase family 4 protein [Sulfurovum sp.]
MLVFILSFKRRYALVLIEYELFPYFPSYFEYLLQKRGIKYLVDYDDALFHKYEDFPMLKDKIAKVMGYADTVIVCNSYLEAYAKLYQKAVFKIPTVVSVTRYREKKKMYISKDETTFVMGWIGSKTTSPYVLAILPVMERIYHKYSNVILHLVGFDESILSKEEKALAYIKVIAWREDTEIEEILAFDIGIMPLPDDKWARGKCAFKLIQYMSAQKAVIASPIGMNTSLIKEGINGFLPSNDDAWFEAFKTLYLSPNLRETMAKNNFEKIQKFYSDTLQARRYMELIKRISNV